MNDFQRYYARKFSWMLSVLLFCSCASLTKSQLNEIQVFGQLTKEFSSYPGKVVSNYNTIHQQQQLYLANGLSTPEEHFNLIAGASDFKIKSDLIVPKIDVSLQIIDQYAQALILLTADRNSVRLDSTSQNFGTNLDSLISRHNNFNPAHQVPGGIGGAVAQLIAAGGNLYIRKKQAEEIRRIIPKADTIVGQMTINLLEFLEGSSNDKINKNNVTLPELLLLEKSNIARNYKRFLGLNRELISVRRGNDTVEYKGTIVDQRFAGLEDDRDCLRLLENLNYTDQLRQQCIAATQNLRKAHRQLFLSIQQKKNLKAILVEIQYYSDDVKKMNASIKAIK